MSDDDLLANWRLITRAVAQTQARVLEAIEQQGVPSQWFAVLHLLLRSRDHRLPMSRLAREVSITSGGFTKLADRMGQEGLIDRRISSGDRRVVYAALTEKGLLLSRRMERKYRAALRENVLQILTPTGLLALAESSRVLDQAHADSADDERVPDVVLGSRRAMPNRRRPEVPSAGAGQRHRPIRTA